MKIKAIVAAAVTAGSFASASLAATYSVSSQGLTFSAVTVDADTFNLTISGTPGGNWAGIGYVGAFSFKDLGLTFGDTGNATATATLINPSTGASVAAVGDELNSPLCAEQVGTGQQGSACFDFSPNIAYLSGMTFQLDFSSAYTFASTGPHLKIAFLTGANDLTKTGSLLSQSLTTSSTSGNVAEPGSASLGLLGLGLLAAGFGLRRKATAAV